MCTCVAVSKVKQKAPMKAMLFILPKVLHCWLTTVPKGISANQEAQRRVCCRLQVERLLQTYSQVFVFVLCPLHWFESCSCYFEGNDLFSANWVPDVLSFELASGVIRWHSLEKKKLLIVNKTDLQA